MIFTKNSVDKKCAGKKIKAFFRKTDWLAFWTAFLISFAVYLLTLAPTVTLEDSGELAVAADYLGVPHPPGYPIWTILSWGISRIFRFVTYLGQPNPSWSIGLLSALFAAMAIGLTAMLVCRSGSGLIRSIRAGTDKENRTITDYICLISGVVSSLLFAFTPVMWSQSVIVEVYSLNAFFLVMIFLLAYRWLMHPNNRDLYLAAFIFGVGLTNYQVLFLVSLALVAAIMIRDPALFRDFGIALIPYIVFIIAIQGGIKEFLNSMNDADGNLSRLTLTIYLAADAIILAASYFLLPRGKTVAITLLITQLGLAFYIYMPIVSDLRNPPMNWGYPRTWGGFKHAILREQYEVIQIRPADTFSIRFIQQIGAYLVDLTKQFYFPIALIGFLPFTAWRVKTQRLNINGLMAAVGCALIAVILGIIEPAGTRWDKIPVIGIFIAMGTGIITMLTNIIAEYWGKIRHNKAVTITEKIVASMMLLGGLILVIVFIIELAFKIMEITAPLRGAGSDFSAKQFTGLIRQSFYVAMLMIIPPSLLITSMCIHGSRWRPRMTIDKLSQKWILVTMTGFVAMSCILILLCNPKGDIQDNFIQKVKFISSHALFSFYIGYGIILVLAQINYLMLDSKKLRVLCMLIALVLPLAPIYKNYYNPVIIKEYGGAEQNGHDFGWQFGNYQLRGADAISEELDSEEPLPNPIYPEAMTPDAVFFGGTDPGRFVPTYMIYSAQVRPDVRLITQNALADNTYLNVMRDLYGDKIWIPAESDNANAFSIYIHEVNAGKRPRNAQISVDSQGRAQVMGVQGVFEINGIICKMIFDHNNYKHDFYVEESYVIPWMFPYLSPHGLIMKINRQMVSLDNRMVQNDLDFWDWYTRRLTGNAKFLRDVSARKSFSKLRSAIAGGYAARNMLPEAERAFHEARILYPLSPEANIRLVHEVLSRQTRLDESREIIQLLNEQDPGNASALEFMTKLQTVSQMEDRIKQLEGTMPNIEANKAIELLDLYQKSGQLPKLQGLSKSILKNKNLPPAFHFRTIQILYNGQQFKEAANALDELIPKLPENIPADFYVAAGRIYVPSGRHDKARECFKRFLEGKPEEWRVQLELAITELLLRNTEGANTAVKQALKHGGQEAIQIIRNDPSLAALQNAP